MAAVTAALVAIGVTATATDSAGATAGTAPTLPKPPANATVAKGPLPTIGARRTPFSPKPTASATRSATAPAADITTTPWVVGIEVQTAYNQSNPTFYQYYCSGTVLSPTKVLAEEGCLYGGYQQKAEVIAGRDDLGDDSVGFVDGVASTWERPTSGAESGPYYSQLTVLTLTQPLPSVYTPVGLVAQGNTAPYAAGTSALTAGYGMVSAEPGMLVQSSVTMSSTAACDASNSGPYLNDLSTEVCATPTAPLPANDTFEGAGNPLVYNNSLIGMGNPYYYQPGASQLGYVQLSAYHDILSTDLPRPAPGNEDWSGDGVTDLFGEYGNGQLADYEGSGYIDDGYNGLSDQMTVDTGNWSGNSKLLRVGNWNGDGRESLLAVASNGNLVEYFPNNTGNGGIDYSQTQVVGTGWGQFTQIVPTNDWNGDGHPDLLAEKADGSLWLYERTGNGWVNGVGVQIGAGFNQFTSLVPFQWTDNGHIGLLGLTPQGNLDFYATDGGGHWTTGSGQLIGVGFTGLRTIIGPGSWGGSDTGAIMTVDSAGNLKAYRADGTGGWLNGNGLLVGVGFQTLKALF